MKNSLLLLCSVLLTFKAQAQHSAQVNWLTFHELDALWEVKPKRTVLFFTTDWCVYCEKMKRVTFRNKRVMQALNNRYYAVEMNAETQDTIWFDQQKFYNSQHGKRQPIHQLAMLFIQRKNEPIAFPVLVLLDEKFTIISRSYQYLSPKQLLAFITQKTGHVDK